MRRCIRFVKALVRWARSGFKMSKEEAKRTRICLRCTYNNDGVCDLCGCVLKYKVKMFTEECPDKRW
jgi:hypothetical protein